MAKTLWTGHTYNLKRGKKDGIENDKNAGTRRDESGMVLFVCLFEDLPVVFVYSSFQVLLHFSILHSCSTSVLGLLENEA